MVPTTNRIPAPMMTTHPTRHNIPLADEAATERLAGQIAAGSRPSDVIGLSGPLGSGKTVFARAFINARTADTQEVPSPTFTLVQEYEFPGEVEGIRVYHFDLFRIENSDDTFELGMDDAFQAGISLIEWPECISHRLPDDRLEITLTPGQDAGSRTADLHGLGSWGPRLEEILAPRD